MAYFPLFLDLEGAPVILVGSDPHKEALLRSFGAEVRVLGELMPEDLEPLPRLVVLAGENRDAQARLCRERNIPVNSVDNPENCSFYFPALIRRGDVTVAISTAGKAPAAAGVLKNRVEEALPENLEQLLPWLAQVTGELREQVKDHGLRTKLLGEITRKAFALGRPLTEEELA